MGVAHLLKILGFFDLLLQKFPILIEALLYQKVLEIGLELSVACEQWLHYHIDVAQLIFEWIAGSSIIEWCHCEV